MCQIVTSVTTVIAGIPHLPVATVCHAAPSLLPTLLTTVTTIRRLDEVSHAFYYDVLMGTNCGSIFGCKFWSSIGGQEIGPLRRAKIALKGQEWKKRRSQCFRSTSIQNSLPQDPKISQSLCCRAHADPKSEVTRNFL